MKKIILAVILVAAVGGITYYLLQKIKQNQVVTITRDLVFGKWKIDSLVPQKDSTSDGLALLLFEMDSNARNLVYDFTPAGKVFIQASPDSTATKDTSSFSWGNDNELLWKEKLTDPATDTMNIIRLDKTDFVLRSADSTLIYFKKVN